MDNDNENAKNPRWKTPVNLPGVKPEDYSASIDSANGSAKGAVDQSGTTGFNPQLSGNAKAGKTNTSSFDAGIVNDTRQLPAIDQEAKNRPEREPTESAVVRQSESK